MRVIGLILFLLLFGLGPVGSSNVIGQSQEKLVTITRDANTAAIQSIRTVDCIYTSEVPGNNSAVAFVTSNEDRGLYRRSGNNIYLRRDIHGYYEETMARDGKVWRLNSFTRKDRSLQRLLGVCKFTCLDRGDVFNYCLLTHWGGASFQTYSYADLLSQSGQVLAAEKRMENGHDLIMFD